VEFTASVGGLDAFGACGWSWDGLGASVGGLGPLLWSMLAVLGCSCGLCWESWAAVGVYVGGLGPLLGLVGDPGPLLGPCRRSSAALGPLRADLGRSWDLSWRSWAALGAYVVEKHEERGCFENVLVSHVNNTLTR